MSRSARRLLLHAPPSYYSQIARLCFAERAIEHAAMAIDIHGRCDHLDTKFARLHPQMTVPVLQLEGDEVIAGSDAILRWVERTSPGLWPSKIRARAEAERWFELHYAVEVDAYTFSHLARRLPPVRLFAPRQLERTCARLRDQIAHASACLAEAYREKLAVVERRRETFFRDECWQRTDSAMTDMLDAMEGALAAAGSYDDDEDAERFLVQPRYSVADLLATVLLSRVRFVFDGAKIRARPRLRRYYQQLTRRPSFERADIWSAITPGRAITMLVRRAG